MLDNIKAQFKRWLAPPVFEGDEEKTWRASLLNAAIIIAMFMLIVIIAGDLVGGRMPPYLYIIDGVMLTIAYLLRSLLFKNKVSLAGILFISLGIILIAIAVASLGTIRTPTTVVFLLFIIVAGVLFEKKGLLYSTASSSFAIFGLIVAENAGLLPKPDYVVNITQWLSYTIIFGLTGLLTYFSYYATRQSLKRLIEESTERKKTEKALRASEEKYRILFNSSPEAIIIRDAEKILYLNAAGLRLLGANTFKEIIGTRIEKYMSTETFSLVNSLTKEMKKTGNVTPSLETTYFRLDGTSFEAEVTTAPVFYEGEPAYQVIMRDITERKEADKTIRQLSRVVEQSASSIVITDLEGSIEFANPAFTKKTGYTAEEALGENPRILKSGHTPPEVFEDMWETLLKGNVWKGELLNKKKNGEHYWEWVIISPVKDEKGETTHFAAVKDDITARKKIEMDLNESEEKFRNLVEQSEDGIVLVAQSGIILEWNQGMTEITGFKRDEMLGTLLWESQYQLVLDERKSPELAKRMKIGIRTLLENKELLMNQKMEERSIQRPDGHIRDMQSISYPVITKNGFMMGIISRDITEKKEAEAKLYKLAQAVNYSGSSILITDLEGKIEFVNTAFSDASGYSTDEIIGQTPRVLKSGKTDIQVYKELWETITQGNVWRGELHNRKKSGELYWDYTVIAPIKDKDEQITHYIAIREDVTKRKEKEGHLVHLATHDPLTELPNRAFFNDRINHALRLAKRNKWQVALLFIDLNDFKLINDRYGHSVGDDALIEFGKRLKESTRDSDTVARMGGDEFACLLENIPSKQYLSVVAEKIIANLENPFEIDQEQSIQFEVSIGISIFPQDGDDCAALLKNADHAMYHAKEKKGKSHYKICDINSR